jgi:hypothetical protein
VKSALHFDFLRLLVLIVLSVESGLSLFLAKWHSNINAACIACLLGLDEDLVVFSVVDEELDKISVIKGQESKV